MEIPDLRCRQGLTIVPAIAGFDRIDTMTTRPKHLPNSDAPSQQSADSGRVSELRASASLMRLEAGLYCVVVAASPHADTASGLPGVRITKAPGPAGRPEAVEIRTIGSDGWVSGAGDAALVRVADGVAHVMVTIYQSPDARADAAPKLQILPLISNQDTAGRKSLSASTKPLPAPAPTPAAPPVVMDVMAHIQTRGDIGALLGDWLGERGCGKWIEGFAIAPTNGVALTDIEYQVVLGRGWTSPWVEGGQFAGSRGMNLPILGLRVRLLGEAAKNFDLHYTASFIDGTQIGPVMTGEACEAPSLAAVEAICIAMTPKGLPHADKKAARDKKRGPKAI